MAFGKKKDEGQQASEGHKNNARPSTQGKHEQGDSRRGRDKGGEKGDARRRGNPNKRGNGQGRG
jgi:hypothetical protein